MTHITLADVAKSQETYQGQIDLLKLLGDNWDGYGAKPLDAAFIERFVNKVRDYVGLLNSFPIPAFVPGADGGLQAEWHLNGAYLEYHSTPAGVETVYLEIPEMGLEGSIDSPEGVYTEFKIYLHWFGGYWYSQTGRDWVWPAMKGRA